MRGSQADTRLLDDLRGRHTRSAYLWSLVYAEGRKRRLRGSGEVPERAEMGSSGDLGPGMDPS